jgi:hypothetical protein
MDLSIWGGAGIVRLVSHRFPHTLADLGSSFQIGFSLWMGGSHLTGSGQNRQASARSRGFRGVSGAESSQAAGLRHANYRQ